MSDEKTGIESDGGQNLNPHYRVNAMRRPPEWYHGRQIKSLAGT
jgi:hypothetical protein